ncbi:unnamed protein product [Phytophthora lilii]|uniref:Unnamed protein product n=1 Tax=Phytophthora lilii TaxID=2077276 RepID=A0A9W6TRD7_9STRA|nr:unnamed protein product [Phytophthora lilii]
MYDRTHNVGSCGQNKEQASRSTQGQCRFHHPQSPVEEPTPMEIGSSRFVSREECLRNNLCFYCKERGHRLADCRKRQTRSASRGSARPAVGQSSFRTNQSSFRRVVEDDDAEEEEEDDTVKLLHKRNIVRPGLAQHFVDAAKVTAERFDGTTTPARTALRCVETLHFADQVFAEVPLIEWEVSVNQDVILGHPWLVQFNPSIDWHTGVMRFREQRKVVDYRAINDSHPVKQHVEVAVVSPEFLQHPMPPDLRQQLNDHVKAGYFHMPLGPSTMPELRCTPPSQVSGKKNDDDEYASLCVLSAEKFESKLKVREYVELFHVTVKTSPKLPPQRSIEHEVVLKPGAQPSNRAPFRLSKVEQEALKIFVVDLVKKNWIQVSDSPWVSNIFGVPKKAPVTGKFPSRLEWLRSNNPHMPIRWLYARPDKCDFGQRSVDFLGHTISEAGLHVDACKTRAIAEWPAPRNVQELQRFLGLAGYYHRFIHGFAQLLLPLSSLVKTDVVWVWDEPQQRAFSSVKLAPSTGSRPSITRL